MLAAEGRHSTSVGPGRLLLLYTALYGAYGALSPFLPAFLETRGLGPG